MHTSIEPRNRIFLKGYGFLTFEKNMGNSLNGKHSQILFDLLNYLVQMHSKLFQKRNSNYSRSNW